MTVSDVDGVGITLYMTPFTLREYIAFIEERDGLLFKYQDMELVIKTTKHLWDTIEAHVPGGVPESIPQAAMEDAFALLNFAGEETVVSGKKRKSPEIENEDLLSYLFDFLISQGHSRSEIMVYTMPEFIGYQTAASNRLNRMYGGEEEGKKKTNKDPLAGIPIKN